MQKIFFGFLLIAAAIYACNKSELNQPARGVVSDVELANKKGVEGLLIGVYSVLNGMSTNPVDAFGGMGSDWLYGSICGSEAHKGGYDVNDQADMLILEIFKTTAISKNLEEKWITLYDGIERANTVLRVMREAKDMTTEDTTEVRSEALFLRAHFHFEAKKIWNSIPMVDETITFGAGNFFVPNDTSWSMIENDLIYAKDHLHETQGQEIGRCNKYAAEAVLSKVYMFEHKYHDAKPLLDELIEKGVTAGGKKYDLEPKYADNFNPVHKNGPESVFAVQTSVNDGSAGSNADIGDWLNFPVPAGYCFFQPSQYFVNHFKTDSVTGLPDFDHFNDPGTDVTNDMDTPLSFLFIPYQGTLDPRLDWTVGRRGVPFLDWGPHLGVDSFIRNRIFGPYNAKKNVYYLSNFDQYTNANNAFWGNATLTANNINLIRFADILLWAAEVEVEIGSLAKATDYINRIRRRASNVSGWVSNDDNIPGAKAVTNTQAEFDVINAPSFQDINPFEWVVRKDLNQTWVLLKIKADGTKMWNPYSQPNYKTGLYDVFPNLEYGRKAVRYERMLELGMEGHRFFDLVRWGIADKEIKAYLQREKNLIIYLNGAEFIPHKNEYFPIPQTEIDKSAGALKQNPGY